jgi:hypothetical protein
VSREHGRRALAGTDKPVGNWRGVRPANGVTAARKRLDSVVMRRRTFGTPEFRIGLYWPRNAPKQFFDLVWRMPLFLCAMSAILLKLFWQTKWSTFLCSFFPVERFAMKVSNRVHFDYFFAYRIDNPIREYGHDGFANVF